MATQTLKLTTKRQRSLNWLEEDKNLLMDLVRERVRIIENKNTDTNSNSKKQAAWADLHTSFNCMCKGVPRTLAQLKAQWSIIKMTQKKIKSQQRKNIIMTGGGPPPPSQTEAENNNDITSWLPNEFVIDDNEFDSDQLNQVKVRLPKIKDETPVIVMMKNKAEDIALEENKVEDIVVQDVIIENVTVEDVTADVTLVEIHNDMQNKEEIASKYTPYTAKPPAVSQTPTPKKPRRKEDYEKTANYAANIAETEIECRKQLHQIQLKNEEKKQHILELEAILLQKKIEYYDKKIKLLEKYFLCIIS